MSASPARKAAVARGCVQRLAGCRGNYTPPVTIDGDWLQIETYPSGWCRHGLLLVHCVQPINQSKLWHPVAMKVALTPQASRIAGATISAHHRQPSPARNPKNPPARGSALFQCFFLFTNNRHQAGVMRSLWMCWRSQASSWRCSIMVWRCGDWCAYR